ncbi:MAG: Asp23/Gls24 family envelope stress response protein [Actinomycetota bacterium]|nr:Asp23/Gls24 family envelope stress response protein [Actinomycetota bacterium]
MSESGQQSSESPLQSERGATIISDTVVSTLAGMAAQEVEGVHMGGGASRTASGVLGSLTGSESKTSGVSVEVGTMETAIDLKMGIEYDRNIRQTVEEVRRRITDRVQNLTGLRITELNATITDITFPEKEQRRRLGSGIRTSDEGSEMGAGPETRTMPSSELRPGAGEREITQVEPTSRTHTEGASGPVPEEEVRVEGRPLEGDETAELRPGDTQDEVLVTDDTSETPEEETRSEETRSEEETSEQVQTDAEARRRRRAQERARRRSTEDG